MKSNPRIRLGTGALPKVGMSQAKREDGITYFVERDNGVLGVIVFSNNKQATKKFNSKSHENLFEQKYPNRNIDYKLVKSSIVGFSMGSDWKKIESTLHPINGSPYTRGGSTQRRSADEAPLVWIEDVVTGTRQSIESNPRSFDVVITIPHAHDDGVDDGHDTDFLAPLLGDLLFESFDARGVPTIVLKSEVDRDLKDLNRSSSANDDFHKTLDKHLAKAGTLYDIHSYPEYYPVWGDYDIVLFHDGPYHSEADNDTVKDLADYLRSKMDADIFIEVADEEKHFIQNKGLLLEKESFLIEINEKRTDLVSDLAEALADFTAGVKANPPTQLPAGGSYQQFVIALPLTKELDKKRHLMFPNILELELVERGFELRRKTLDPTETFANSMSFGLPDGLPQEPSVQFQRGKGTNFKIYRAQYLSNEELYLIHTLVDESTKNQPILNPWEPKKNIKQKLADMGINESQHEVIWKLIENQKSFDKWNEIQERKGFKTLTQEQIDELSGFMVPDIDDSSSNKEIEDELKKYNYDIPKKQNKLNRSKALSYFHIIGEFSDDEDIEKELKRRNISIPKKGNKLDREKALEKISTSTTVKQTSVGQFVEAKKQKMNLSTKVTQAVIKALIPGARKLTTVSGDPSEKRVITSSGGKKREMTFEEFVKTRGGNLSDKQKAQWDSSPKVGGGKGKKGGQKRKKDDPNEKRLVNGEEMNKGTFSFKYRPKNQSDWAVWDNAAKINPPVKVNSPFWKKKPEPAPKPPKPPLPIDMIAIVGKYAENTDVEFVHIWEDEVGDFSTRPSDRAQVYDFEYKKGSKYPILYVEPEEIRELGLRDIVGRPFSIELFVPPDHPITQDELRQLLVDNLDIVEQGKSKLPTLASWQKVVKIVKEMVSSPTPTGDIVTQEPATLETVPKMVDLPPPTEPTTSSTKSASE